MLSHFKSNRDRHTFVRCIVAWLLIVGTHAAQAEVWKPWPFNDDKPGKPQKLMALWSETVLTKAGQAPIRGFGGRIMFYDGKKEDPIKVEGTLVVYAFDETDREPGNARPDRKYVFTAQQFPEHYSKSKIGHSYSVWLPWEEIGGIQKDITLIVRFEPKEGSAVIGESCRQLLPGRIVPNKSKPVPSGVLVPGSGGGPSLGAVEGTNNPNGVQPASYETPVGDNASSSQAEWAHRRMTTSTIPLTSGMAIRSALAAPPQGNNQPAGGMQQQPTGWRNNPSPNYQQQNFQPQNYQPPSYQQPNYRSQGYIPGANAPQQPTSATPGPQLRAGFAPGRQWPLGEPLARLSRDRAQLPPRPAGSPYGLATPPVPDPASAMQASPSNGPQSPN